MNSVFTHYFFYFFSFDLPLSSELSSKFISESFFVNFALKMENGCRFKGDMCCFLRAKCEDA